MRHGTGNDKRRRVPGQTWTAQEAGRPLLSLGNVLRQALEEKKRRRHAEREKP